MEIIKMNKIINNFSVCECCLQAIIKEDYSSLNYYYGVGELVASIKRALIQSETACEDLQVPTLKIQFIIIRKCQICEDPLHNE